MKSKARRENGKTPKLSYGLMNLSPDHFKKLRENTLLSVKFEKMKAEKLKLSKKRKEDVQWMYDMLGWKRK